MRTITVHRPVLVVLAVFGLATASCTHADVPPGFQEVYGLLQSHLKGVTGEELNRAAVEGLVASLKPKVALIGGRTDASGAESPTVSMSRMFDGRIAYIRVAKVSADLPANVAEAMKDLSDSNRLTGLVLDLRNAEGDDYAAAAGVVDLFLGDERTLFDWGKGPMKSKAKSDDIRLPVAVLVNGDTTGAAEALAAVLRDVGRALLIGRASTAGGAFIMEEFPLQDGRRLRVAVEPVKWSNGAAATGGVRPDILVTVKGEDESAYLADPFRDVTRAASSGRASLSDTNTPSETNRGRRRLNEAELVRERREGVNPTNGPSRDADREAEKPAVRDPVLARALDVLKGLAVVRQWQSN